MSRSEFAEADADAVIARQGFVPSIGQLPARLRRRLDRRARSGELVKYRGAWNTGDARCGLLPFKTIYATPAFAAAAAGAGASAC